jgi:hypothetical protein
MNAREALAEHLFLATYHFRPDMNWSVLSVSARALWYNKADAVLQVLAEHGDTQQVREEIADAVRRAPRYQLDAVMAVVARIVAARDAAAVRANFAEAYFEGAQGKVEYLAKHLGLARRHADRAEAELTDARADISDLKGWVTKEQRRAERAEAEVKRLATARLVLAVFGTPDDAPQPFSLCRDTKVVGLGVQWPGGAVTIKWTPPERLATVTSHSLEDALAVADFPDGTLGVVWLSEDLGTLAEAEERAIRAEADLAAAQMQVRVRDAQLEQMRKLAGQYARAAEERDDFAGSLAEAEDRILAVEKLIEHREQRYADRGGTTIKAIPVADLRRAIGMEKT